MSTSRMCFVAGTLVHTAGGLVPIEEVRAGDLVLSRDERTGEQAYKPVLETFVTRPDALYTVTYDPDGDGPLSPDIVVTTAPHPFYVTSRDGDGDGESGGFVPAAELEPGDLLALADGSAATVTARDIEYAGPADEYLTYNFEVEDFHTYFVNADGVWVHNTGTECERIFSLFRRVMAKLTPDDPMAAYKKVADKLPNMTETAQRGFVDDVLKEIREMSAATPSTLSERLRRLGKDPRTDQFSEREAFGGYRFENKTGKTLRRPSATDPGDPDFIEQDGTQWDLKGPLPSAGNFDGFLESIRIHIRDHPGGDERLVVDAAGLNTAQVDRIKAVLSTYNRDFYELLEN